MPDSIHVTEPGRSIALSGILPKTANYLLRYLAENGPAIVALKDNLPSDEFEIAFSFLLSNAALTSPEFTGDTQTRFIPFGFRDIRQNELATKYKDVMSETVWQAYRDSANAADLLAKYVQGVPLRQLEGQYQAVQAGTVENLAREVSWCISGLANFLSVCTRPELTQEELPTPFQRLTSAQILDIRGLLGELRLLSWQFNTGLPRAMLWISEFRRSDRRPLIRRNEALELHKNNLTTFEHLRMRNNFKSIIEVFKLTNSPSPHARAEELQSFAHSWHEEVRIRSLKRQLTITQPSDHELVERFHNSRELEFQRSFEAFLSRAGIPFQLFDDASKSAQFDYIISIPERPQFLIECKTKTSANLVGLDEAKVVLSNSELHGYSQYFCVTLCQPGINPDVPPQLSSCTRLSVVEGHEFAEVLIRVMRGRIKIQTLADWLTQPGRPRLEEIASLT